jgi:thymidylate kinase
MKRLDHDRHTIVDRIAVPALQAIDAALPGRVVMTSEAPAAAGDVDFLCRAAEREAIATVLVARGFLPRRSLAWVEQWAYFGDGHGYRIDINKIERYGLPPTEVERFYHRAIPFEPYGKICRPAPVDVVLLNARRLARARRLPDKRYARVREALAEQENLWDVAYSLAPLWGLEAGLALLEKSLARGTRIRRTAQLAASVSLARAEGSHIVIRSAWARVRAGARRRGAVVAFSGLDGSGKSTQVRLLMAALSDVGVGASSYRRPLVASRPAQALRRIAKRVISAGHAPIQTAVDSAAPARRWDPNPITKRLRERSTIATRMWATFVALSIAGHYRLAALRGSKARGVVIFDRYQLDAIAQLDFLYGRGDQLAFERWLVRFLTARPSQAYLLDVPAERAYKRKELQYDRSELTQQAELLRRHAVGLGVTVLDGERAPHDLGEHIAREVWSGLG